MFLFLVAMVSALDDAVGAVYAALKANNMIDNSIIVFTTDNGGPANGFDYNAANNFPLRYMMLFYFKKNNNFNFLLRYFDALF